MISAGTCMIPVALQATAMLVDEAVFHRRRGLGRWERLGHPLDTLTIALCLVWLLAVPRDAAFAVPGYVVLAVFSTLFVTKDEPIHARACTAGEHWLHAILFILHPIVLAAFAFMWWAGEQTLLAVQLALVGAFGVYQLVYWNVVRDRRERPRAVNNTWYAPLGERWYEADDTPIALLRAEARHRNPWIADTIARELGTSAARVLDLGCGAGFLSNDLAARGAVVTGLDASTESLAVAAAYDRTGKVTYRCGDALALPFDDGSFDVVCAMDLLEHVEDPARLVAEAARVLAPGGMFFFHTFNRTRRADLIVIKGVSWFVANAPPDLHVLRLFITPDELAAMCERSSLAIVELRGSRPRFRWPLWRMLLTGRVGDDFAFTFTPSLALGYSGVARKRRAAQGR
jgi:2-polyprenyl-6-hydroxyphenyl methylase / 3-demethylubiquinone-9 3-methyltransferase